MANKYEMRRRARKDGGGRTDTVSQNRLGSARRDRRAEKAPLPAYRPYPPLDRKGLTVALSLCLVMFVVLLYVQTARHAFTVCDDNVYIYEKPQIVSGVTWENVKWAFGDAHEGNWHPLTWITHMLDWQLFSEGSWEPQNKIYGYSWPGGHHLMNAAIHGANAVLLFLAFRLMTGTLWPSFVVAALFAVHPLRAESVAWAAERKDVLCGLFWMSTMVTYAIYARRPPLERSTPGQTAGTIALYLLVNVFMALGLTAKSMIVTLPCVLVLLDIWPLGRWTKPSADGGREVDFLRGAIALVEKIPLVALAVGDSLVTVYGQQKGVALNSFEGLPLWVRVLNAIESCGEYLRQFFWPTGLAPFYSHPYMVPPYISTGHFSTEFLLKTAIYTVLLTTVTLVCVLFFVRRTYLAVGWFWYLGALMPVIGIIQVGTQARADRYTYLPMIGVYVMIAWLLKDVADRWPRVRPLLAGGGVVVLTALSAAAFLQASYWYNSYKLFFHSIGVRDVEGIGLARVDAEGPDTGYFGYDKQGKVDLEKTKGVLERTDNYFAFNHIGIQFDSDGKKASKSDMNLAQRLFDHSAAAFAATLAIKSDYDFGNNNLGVYLRGPANRTTPWPPRSSSAARSPSTDAMRTPSTTWASCWPNREDICTSKANLTRPWPNWKTPPGSTPADWACGPTGLRTTITSAASCWRWGRFTRRLPERPSRTATTSRRTTRRNCSPSA